MCTAAASGTVLIPLFGAYLAVAVVAGLLLIVRTRHALAGRYSTWDLCALLSETGGRPGAARWDRIDPVDRPVLAARRRLSRLGGLALAAVFAILWLSAATSC